MSDVAGDQLEAFVNSSAHRGLGHSFRWLSAYAKAFFLGDFSGAALGTMRTDGSSERMLTESFLDEGPTWAPNGRVVMFTRATPGGNGQPRLHSVDITGRNMRPMNLDFAASDPSWGPLLP